MTRLRGSTSEMAVSGGGAWSKTLYQPLLSARSSGDDRGGRYRDLLDKIRRESPPSYARTVWTTTLGRCNAGSLGRPGLRKDCCPIVAANFHCSCFLAER